MGPFDKRVIFIQYYYQYLLHLCKTFPGGQKVFDVVSNGSVWCSYVYLVGMFGGSVWSVHVYVYTWWVHDILRGSIL